MSYTYTVAAYDAAGNTSPQSAAVSATTLATGPSDTQAPSAPTNLLATAVTSSQINLSWYAPNDNVMIAGYQIWRGAAMISTVTGTSYSDTGLVSNTTYTYTVRAFDNAGNVSMPSLPASVTTFSITNEPPTPNIGTWRLMSLSSTQIMNYTDSVAVNEDIYVYKGGGWPDYLRYSIADNSWHSIASIPDDKARPYSNLTWLGDDNLYVFDHWGSSGPGLWQYSISNNIWTNLSSYPGGTVYSGTNAVGATVNNEKLIYVITGPDDFWKYSIADNNWHKMTSTLPFPSVMISTDNNYVYGVHIIGNAFWRYSLSDNTLTTLASSPVVFETYGGKLAKPSGDNIYAIRSGAYDYVNEVWLSTSDIWRYSISRNEWFSLDLLPKDIPPDEGLLTGVTNGLYLIVGGPESAVYFLPIN
jgi:chitodextrinase